MSVYVDGLRDYAHAPRRGRWCHMIADTTTELMDMARAIGHDASWVQDAGTYREHFDICGKVRRDRALRHGALVVTSRELVEIMRAKKGKE